MAYLSDEAPASLSNVVGVVGLFYLAVLVAALAIGTGLEADLVPALDWAYASNFTA